MDIEGHEPPALRGLARFIAAPQARFARGIQPACLAVQEQDRCAYLRLIFAVHPRCAPISSFGDNQTFARLEDLMAYWSVAGGQLAANGTLGEGSLHFDLVAARG